MNLLEILKKNKTAILQAELGALLHDIDKAMPDFKKDPSNHTCPEKEKTGFIPSFERRGKRLKQLIEKDEKVRFQNLKTDFIQYWTDTVTTPDGTIRQYFDALNDGRKYSGNFKNKLRLEGRRPDDPDDFGTVLSAAYHHHNHVFFDRMPMLAMIVHGAFGGADGIDSELDKEAEKKQKGEPFKIDTPFGGFQQDWQDVTADLKEYIKEIDLSNPDLKEIKNRLRPLMSKALGETRYPCNDVTLWAHSYSVASLAKAILAKILIEFSQGKFSSEDRYMLPVRSPGENDNATDFTFVKISIDRNHILSQAQKAGDVVAIVQQIRTLQDAIQDHIENELLVGNETYRDEEKQLFLLPKLNTWKMDGGWVFDGLHEKFEQQVEKALRCFIEDRLIAMNCNEFPFAIEFAPLNNDAPSSKNVSQRVLTRSAYLFETPAGLRQSARGLLKIAEAGFQHGARCEVCGVRSIGSAKKEREDRLCFSCCNRRHDKEIWKQRHIPEELITSDLGSLINRKKENKLCLFSAFFGMAQLFGGDLFEQVRWEKNGEIIQKKSSPGRLYRSYEILRQFFEEFQNKNVRQTCPNGLFPITLSPVSLEFVTAAIHADDLMTQLKEVYEKEFGKFRAFLPLSVGLVFFYHKFPLYIVLETGQRFRSRLTASGPEYWQVKEINNNAKTWQLELEASGHAQPGGTAAHTKWNIPAVLSDDKEKDVFYLNFRLDNGGWKKISELNASDSIAVNEGRFDFLFLDSAVRRFSVTPKGLHHHSLGLRRAYPFDAWSDYKTLIHLVQKLNPNQVGAIEGLLTEKRLFWSRHWNPDDPTIRGFCESVLFSPNAFGKKNIHGQYVHLDISSNQDPCPENSDRSVLMKAAANGLLLDVIDLFMHLERPLA